LKIDKAKLNTLLRSGLNPDIKTRKHLAAHLGLDPTSLTRWFSTRDRLGNPRYPVVPDRHVTKILNLFNLSAEALSLNEEEFRQHCFELSLQNSRQQDDLNNKIAARLEKAEQRKLTIKNYPNKRNNKWPLVISTSVLFVSLIGVIIYWNNLTHFSTPTTNKTTSAQPLECWKGFSTELGDYSKEDAADPCHYAKLLHNALSDLESKNTTDQPDKANTSFAATQHYILFLSEQLDQRRLTDKIKLNIELGKNEFRNKNYLPAQQFFKNAQDILRSSDLKEAIYDEEIALYLDKINAALNAI